MNLLLRPFISSIVRQLLTVLAAALVARGAWTSEQGNAFISQNVDAVVAAVLFAVPLVWSYVQKRAAAKLTMAAQSAPPGTSLQAIAAKSKWIDLSPLGKVGGVLFLALCLPALAGAQTATINKPSVPPVLVGCANPDWSLQGNAWVPVCLQAPPMPASPAPDMGIFCGRSAWQFDEEAGRAVPVCLTKSKLYRTLEAAEPTIAGIQVSTTLTDLQAGRIGNADPLMRPLASHPWAAGALQAGMVMGTQLTTDDWFQRHPTLAGAVRVALVTYRAGAVAWVAVHAK